MEKRSIFVLYFWSGCTGVYTVVCGVLLFMLIVVYKLTAVEEVGLGLGCSTIKEKW
jgi:hypothetical protein